VLVGNDQGGLSGTSSFALRIGRKENHGRASGCDFMRGGGRGELRSRHPSVVFSGSQLIRKMRSEKKGEEVVQERGESRVTFSR